MALRNPIPTLTSVTVRMGTTAARTLLPCRRHPKVQEWAAPLGVIPEQRRSLQVTSRPAGWMLTIRTYFIWLKHLPMCSTAAVCKADTSTTGLS